VRVAWLHVAPVKGLRIEERERVELGPSGVEDDRRFCVVDETGRLLNGKRLASLTTIAARFDLETGHLHLRFSNGSSVGGTIAVSTPITVTVYGHAAPGHLVDGPWTAALSDELGRSVRLVRFDGPGNGHDRADDAAGATLLSTGSLERLRHEAGSVEPVDPRRFRMLIGVSDGMALWSAVLLWGFPLANLAFVSASRLRRGRSILVGDRSHLYDVLHSRFGLKAALTLCWSFAAICAVLVVMIGSAG